MSDEPDKRPAGAPDPAREAPDGAREGARERKKLAGRAGIVGLGTLASRLLGLVRDATLAAVFSRGETDAFWVAFTIPNALRQLLAEGATSSAVVPVLAEVRAQEGDDAARRFHARVRGLSLVALAFVSVLGVIFAGPLVDLFAGGLRARPGAFERTVELTRWVSPYIFFMGTAALGMAALQTWGRFAAASFAPALLNVAFVACAFGLPSWLALHGREPVLALAAGALVGGVLQVVAQWPSLAKIGFLGRPELTPSDRRVRQVLARMAPMTIGIGIYYVDLVLSRRFLSELPEGSQSFFSWAMRLCDFPQGIFVLALQAATLPSLAKLVAGGHRDEAMKTWAYGMRLALFVALPATALLVGLARPIVVLLFQRGAFDEISATETARALVAQGAGVWTVAIVRQVLPVYYALGDTRTPVVVSLLDLLVFVVLAVALRGPLGHVGVGWAVAGSSAAQMALLWAGLAGKRLPSLHAREIGASALRTALASLAAAAAGAWAAAELAPRPGAAAITRTFPAIGGGAAFAATFLAVAWLARSPELRELGGGLARKLGRRGGRARVGTGA